MNKKEILIELNQVCKTYYKNIAIQVLKGINLSIYDNEFLCIMGPSGSGKTTLLSLIGCLDKPTSGKIFVDKVDTTQLSDDSLALLRNKKFGFIFQNFNLIPYLDVLHNVWLPLWYTKTSVFSSEKEEKEYVVEIIKKVGLGHRIGHKPTELSGGEQQRVAIARALINKPKVLLADEPTGNLDTKTGSTIIELFHKLKQEDKITIVLVTHNPAIGKQTQRVVLLQDGEIVSDNSVSNS